jgi:hypothetical protein
MKFVASPEPHDFSRGRSQNGTAGVYSLWTGNPPSAYDDLSQADKLQFMKNFSAATNPPIIVSLDYQKEHGPERILSKCSELIDKMDKLVDEMRKSVRNEPTQTSS